MDAQEATTAPQEDAPEIVSAFPLPPAFFELYRDGPESGPAPPTPMEPQYHMFGTPYSTQDVVPDLLPMPGKKLYLSATSDAVDAKDTAKTGASGDEAAAVTEAAGSVDGIDFKAQMKKINRSLLANFMELVDVLIHQPAMFNDKLNDLELLFLNMHNLINAFRPHQARETVIHMLKMQIQERRDAVQEIRKTIDDARKNVEEVHADLHDHAADEQNRSQDADVKMEDVHAVSSASSAAGASSAPQQQAQGELTAKAREAQQMQEAFFAALQAVGEAQ